MLYFGSGLRRTDARLPACCLAILAIVLIAFRDGYSQELAVAETTASDGGAVSPEAFWNNDLQPFLKQYCYDCHSGSGAEADIDFEKYDSPALLANERPRWEQVRGMIAIGAMPPVDYDPLPTMEDRERISRWIDRTINSVDCGVSRDPGRVTMRRLNNVEYDNALRDLLGIDFSPSSLIGFPSDGVGNGFDNQGDVLTLSPLQLEKYLQAAKLIAANIIVEDPESLREQKQDLPALYAGDSGSVRFLFADGSYEIVTRLTFEDDKEEHPIPVILLIDGQEIERIEVKKNQRTHRIDHQFTAGEHELTVRFAEDPYSDKKAYQRRIETDYVAINGPKDSQPALPLAHRRLFAAYPSDDRSAEDAAREIFQPLMRRAFRREPQAIEVERVVNLVKLAIEQGMSFENAVGHGLQAVLASPHFLFRVEGQSSPDDAHLSSPSEELDDFPLASRLSFFLWASGPDDTLLDLASQGALSDPATLQAQALRMLADPRSNALVERFFSQYLGLGNLNVAAPDPNQFPAWNDHLRDAMRRETELVCQEIIREDRSLTELLAGDFTYVNPRLAELYGLDFDGHDPADLYRDGPGFQRRRGQDRTGLYRDEARWIRVSLPAARRGVLTQAAILTLTSNPTGTSPVKRGKWILESLLGDPPPPAPPNVPGFEETKKEHGDLSLRQQLEIHRANPSCASCHRVMDPLGLGFENFDAIGRWRDKDGEHAIDATGELADGRKFKNSAELIQLLQARQPEIMRNFAEKLLTYALGRGLEPYDNCAIEVILEAAAAKDYRMSSWVTAIVTSEPFSQRRSIAEPSQTPLAERN